MRGINYNGKPELNRNRSLFEEPLGTDLYKKIDRLPEARTEKQQVVDRIFKDLAKTYIKGNVLQRGMANMDPASFIPITDGADSVRGAARRFDKDQSINGTRITFSMYQSAIDRIFDDNSKIQAKYLKVDLPVTKIESNRELVSEKSRDSDAENFIKAFLEENGIAGSILSMLTLAPFQSIIFQTLQVEKGAQSVNALQIPAGLALFIELGIKAERIYRLLKKSNPNIALTESQVADLENNEVSRAEALGAVNIDHDELKQALAPNDSKIIIDYVSEYYQRYNGLQSPNSHLTIDHWIGYMQVAQNQNMLNSALRTAPKFTDTFDSIMPKTTQFGEGGGVISENFRGSKVRAHVDLMSVLRELNGASNTIYDDIANAFTHQLTDRQLCCLISLFGGIKDTELLRTIAIILRILATDISGEIIRLDNILRRYIQRELQNVLFDIIAQLNEFYDKIQAKISDLFTIDLDAEACGGLLTIGYALLTSVRVIYKQIQSFISDISQLLMDFGQVQDGSWKVAAERRHLLGMAKILEVVANKFDVLSICDEDDAPYDPDLQYKDRAANEVITQLLEIAPPNVQLSDDEFQKYFGDTPVVRSEALAFTYGVNYREEEEINQGTNTGSSEKPCKQAVPTDKLEEMLSVLKRNLTEDNG